MTNNTRNKSKAVTRIYSEWTSWSVNMSVNTEFSLHRGRFDG